MVCVSSHLPLSLHLVKNDLQLCNNTELVDRNKMAKNTHFSKRESNEKQTVLDFRWVVKKNAGNVMLVDWAQAAKTCSHHFWRGRKQDWDTIQRTKVVLQDSREKDCENGVDIFFSPPPSSSVICVKASWITAVVTRWCCKGRFDPCVAGPGRRMKEWGSGGAPRVQIIIITRVQPSDWWRL